MYPKLPSGDRLVGHGSGLPVPIQPKPTDDVLEFSSELNESKPMLSRNIETRVVYINWAKWFSETKICVGNFLIYQARVGSDIGKLMFDSNFEAMMSTNEKVSWISFKEVFGLCESI